MKRYPSDERRDRERIPRQKRGRSPVRPIREVINTLFRGFVGGGVSSSSRKKHVRFSRTTHSIQRRSMSSITFTDEEFQDIDPNEDY